MITCFGGFLVGQAAARLMLQRGGGTILFTGASASYKRGVLRVSLPKAAPGKPKSVSIKVE